MAECEANRPDATCPVVMSGGYPCGREVYDDKGRCICHSEESDKDAAAFQREIKSMLARNDHRFNDVVFPPGVSFPYSTFGKWADFSRAVFHGRADFTGAHFEGPCLFAGTQFRLGADFTSARFGDRAEFSSAEFGQDALEDATSFNGATFSEVDFSGAQFHQAVRFGLGEMFVQHGPILQRHLHPTTFKQWACFRMAHFHRAIEFISLFSDDVDMSFAHFDSEVVAVGEGDKWVFSREADLRSATFGEPSKVHFVHVFLGRARLLYTDVGQVDFVDVEWAKRSDGRLAVWDEMRAEDRGEEKDHALIGNLYRQLKHSYENRSDPITAGDFHFGEMEMRRLEKPPTSAVARFLKRYLSAIALYRWISGYGEDYAQALACIAGVILAFAVVFAYIPVFALEPGPSMASQSMQGFGSRLVHSAMCFLLRGDQPLQPMYPPGHYWSVMEGVIGPPLIALFILALSRRFKR